MCNNKRCNKFENVVSKTVCPLLVEKYSYNNLGNYISEGKLDGCLTSDKKGKVMLENIYTICIICTINKLLCMYIHVYRLF